VNSLKITATGWWDRNRAVDRRTRSTAGTDTSRGVLAPSRLCRGHFGAGGIGEFQGGEAYRAPLLHRGVVPGQVASKAAVLERQTVGIFEVNGLRETMVNDVRDINPSGAQFVALVGQRRFRAGFQSEVIKGARNAESAIYPRVVFRRHGGNSAGFHECYE